MTELTFATPKTSEALDSLRAEVRSFLATEIADRTPLQKSDSWNGLDTEFSRKLGQKGWLGMTWPTQYGGHARTEMERYVVIEELLAAGAPVSAHWIADRQTGPLILKFGTEEQKQTILPRIAAGECFASIGMSEPDAGSDLASVRTRAEPVDEGYRINGTKVWTTNAHVAHYMILFCRTHGTTEDRQKGTSQLLIDMSTPGIEVKPIIDLAGQHHFNQVVFNDVLVPKSALLGEEGNGWAQVMSELSYERSGPERFLSSFELIVELGRILAAAPHSESAAIAYGRLLAHTAVLRRLSRGVSVMLQEGEDPLVHASIVKDLGATLEQEIPEIVRQFADLAADPASARQFREVTCNVLLNAPTFSLRGGTREILRGIIARGLGLR
ncbi:acyl-CoA dehydrogenase family protein [Roseovarius indicus]|uniref:acyl-CoA dehydrogenase family protein n=1 Tax=Roseovarius indicus TaxID=540747 RepID=UPI0032F06D22